MNVNQMTQQQALLGVLALVLTADNDQDAAKAVKLAARISSGLSESEIEHCQDLAVEIRDLATERVRDQAGSPSIHVVCAKLTEQYQRKLAEPAVA